MRTASIYGHILVSLLAISAVAAQDLENITVLPFEGWTGNASAAREYQNALTDKIATKIIQSHRFNVIDRTHLDKVLAEQDLQMSGLINESSVVQMGKLLGVHKLIIGNFTRSSTEHHKAEYANGQKISDAYYSAVVQTTIKLLDVQNSRYLEATEAEGTGQGSDRRNALLDALDEVADAVMKGFEEYFAIQAHIVSVDKAMVTIDRGSLVGVQEGMDFLVFPVVKGWIPSESSASDQFIGVIRVVSVENSDSRARIMVGFDKIKSGQPIRESKEEIATAAMIMDKTGSQVIINAGIDLGIKSGMTFDVLTAGREITDPATGEVIRTAPVNVGVIYITNPGARSSEAKIIKGQDKVEPGMWILERETATISVSGSLSAGLLSAAFAPNQVVNTFSVENRYTGTHEVAVDYSAYEDITSGTVMQLAGLRRDLVQGYSVGFALNLFNYSSNLSAWALDIMATYDINLIPDRLTISPGLRIGYGSASQKLPGGIVALISDNQSSSLNATGFPITPQVNLRAKIGNLTIFGEVAYRLWNIDTWTYDVKTGQQTESGDDETESVDLDSNLVPYPEISVGGLYFSFGISIDDFWSKITDLL